MIVVNVDAFVGTADEQHVSGVDLIVSSISSVWSVWMQKKKNSIWMTY